ncbi:hypothetical protein F5878DRAFT_627745 [Lentinula raphanica]|uniref:Uncharacterized protein n=1 Tax=Lentinula raphanica TaxID=153919 RepID=A0AA38P3M4_9AGAR|nr:hypothetical protein F5878DRAFT_627745 [Lentinula raphanica]
MARFLQSSLPEPTPAAQIYPHKLMRMRGISASPRPSACCFFPCRMLNLTLRLPAFIFNYGSVFGFNMVPKSRNSLAEGAYLFLSVFHFGISTICSLLSPFTHFRRWPRLRCRNGNKLYPRCVSTMWLLLMHMLIAPKVTQNNEVMVYSAQR